MPYCIYLRKSRMDEEAEQKGTEADVLARHRETLNELAAKMGLPVTHTYQEVKSGDSIEGRPEMQALLRDVEQGRWQGVFVMEVERLARGDTVDQGVVARTFKYSGTKIITPLKTYDPADEYDEEYFEFSLFMSRREYKTIARRIQRGRIKSANEGKYLGATPPYGYDKVKLRGEQGYTLAPNEHEAPVVHRIYEMYTTGSGKLDIAQQLNEQGVPTRRGGPWSRSIIQDILANPVYTGIIRWSYKKQRKYSVNGVIRERREKNDAPILVAGRHEAIISKELYETAKLTRAARSVYTITKSKLQNPLSGLVYCGYCGALMTRLGANSHNKYAVMRCSKRGCENISAPLELVERSMLDSLRAILDSYELRPTGKRVKIDTEINAARRAGAAAEKIVSGLQQQLSRAYDLMEQGIYSAEQFKARREELEGRLREANQKYENACGVISALESEVATAITVTDLRSVLDGYPQLPDAAAKNEVLKKLIKKSTYQKTQQMKKGRALDADFQLDVFPRFGQIIK